MVTAAACVYITAVLIEVPWGASAGAAAAVFTLVIWCRWESVWPRRWAGGGVYGAPFQLFDGLQVMVTGALRGLGDTRTSMFAHFAGDLGVAASGIWVGLAAALILIGLALPAA